MIAKLHSYGFTISTLKMVHSYLINRCHRTKINATFITWKEFLTGVPQGSVLGPLLFNIQNDLFFILEETNVCNYADGTGVHACHKDIGSLMRSLEHDTHLAIDWSESNYMKLNKAKWHLFVSGHKFEHVWINIGGVKIWEADSVTMLGVSINNNLKFDNHVSNLRKKSGKKTFCFDKVSQNITFSQNENINEIIFRLSILILPTNLGVYQP